MKEIDKESVFFKENNQTYAELDIRQWALSDFKTTEVYSGKELTSVLKQVVLGGNSNFEVTDRGDPSWKERYTYHVIGNTVKKGTVASIQTGFEDENGDFNFGLCDMAGKLMTAMYRVTLGDFGDVRCLLSKGTSGTAGFLHIDNSDGSEYIHINVMDSMDKEPVEAIKEAFLEWRKKNPRGSSSDKSSVVSMHVSILRNVVQIFAVLAFGIFF